MGVLDELKKQARALRESKDANDGWSGDVEPVTRAELVNRLGSIHDYLRDLVEQLNFVKPEIKVDYTMDRIGILRDLQQGEYEILTEGEEEIETISLMLSMNNDEEFAFNPDPAVDVSRLQNKIKNYGLITRSAVGLSNDNTQIVIQGYVPVRLDWKIDAKRGAIVLTVQNFNEFGVYQHAFKASDIDDVFLEELGKFVLRRENTLFEAREEAIAPPQPDTSSEMATPRIGEMEFTHRYPEQDLLQTQEIKASRINSMFNQKSYLQLSYHNKVRTIRSDTPGFVAGRAGSCDMVVNTDCASRSHARFVCRKGKFVLIDESTNGTFVKTYGGKEICLQRESYSLSGSGLISLGKPIGLDQENLIYYSCR